MARFKDFVWEIPANRIGSPETWEQVNTALLMDIRDELKKLNSAIYCHNALRIPQILDKIAANTTKRRKKPAKKAVK